MITSWKELACKLKEQARHSTYDMASMPVILVSEDEETDDGYVHDVYVTNVVYYSDELERLSDSQIISELIEVATSNEKHFKEYKTDKGLENFIKRVKTGQTMQEYGALIKA